MRSVPDLTKSAHSADSTYYTTDICWLVEAIVNTATL